MTPLRRMKNILFKYIRVSYLDTQTDSLCAGGKKTSELGLVLVHLYSGAGLPSSELQARVMFPLRTGLPLTWQTGTEGGTKRDRMGCVMLNPENAGLRHRTSIWHVHACVFYDNACVHHSVAVSTHL